MKTFAALSILVTGLGMSGCTPVTAFTPTVKGAGIPQIDPICQVGTSSKNLRILFMIDDSGSSTSTDPGKKFRVETIQKFISAYGGKSNLSYSFGYFQGPRATMYNMSTNAFSSTLPSTVVGSSSQLSTALLNYESITSSDNTPYKAAFDTLKAVVNADSNPGHDHDYIVVFESDGQPTDISGIANLKGLVTDLRSAATAKGALLNVSTVYFGPATDTASITNLSSMADAGAGQFVDTNKASGIALNDIISVPGCTSQASLTAQVPAEKAPNIRAPASTSLLTVQ